MIAAMIGTASLGQDWLKDMTIQIGACLRDPHIPWRERQKMLECWREIGEMERQSRRQYTAWIHWQDEAWRTAPLSTILVGPGESEEDYRDAHEDWIREQYTPETADTLLR
jgi:hypothetical protein